MMDVAKHIGSYMVTVKESDLPQTYKTRVSATLEYFKQQSLCDLDRRHPERKLKENWNNLLTMLKGTNLIDAFRKNETAWRAIEGFVGIPSITPSSKPQKKEKFEGQEAHDIFNYLIHKSARLEVLTKEEVQVVQLGLYYLHVEAMRGRGQRDKRKIVQTWSIIQPLLRKFGLLSEFDSSTEAVRKIKNFVADRFL